MPKDECPFCQNNPENITDDDFCPMCGIPSLQYTKFIEEEMEENGELDPY
ncbi:MAG: hypothetical protein WC668_04455 [Patescibacteria group bacterium]|jgi:rubredoxin